MQARIQQPPSELMSTQTGVMDGALPLSAVHEYSRSGKELLNSYFDPASVQQSFKAPAIVGMQRWDRYPEDDDYSDEGNSDRELSGSRQQLPSRLLPTSMQSPMFNASQPYLCSSSVIDRMCATFSQQSNTSTTLLNPDRFAVNHDQLTMECRSGAINHPQLAVQSVDQSSSLNPFSDGVFPVEHERVLYDGIVEQLASDDEPFHDTGSESPFVVEDRWQCVVDDGEVELT